MYRVLDTNPGSSFSDLWYRVGPTRPRLGVHAQVIRQRFGGRTVFILEDPAGGQYYRVSEAAHFFIGLLDGTRTVDEAWQTCATQLGDAAPTQRECVDVLSRLQLFGLLVGDLPIDPEMLEVRRAQGRLQRLKQRTGMGFSPSLPLINPEPWLQRWSAVLRPIFSLGGLVLWLAMLAWGLYEVASKWGDLSSRFNTIINPDNLLLGTIVFLLLRAWHEFGHAVACKALGGRCTEMGLIFMMLVLPFPYCDTSSAWRFPQVWKRVLVSAGGMLFETFVAAIAAIVWSRTDDPTLRSVCFNIMVISGVTTILFNLNPLLRYDGYYILSDLTGAANLWQRSRDLIRFLVEKLAFNSGSAQPPFIRDRAEFWLLLLYGLASYPYRLFVSFTIILVIWSNPNYATLGPVLASIAIVVFVFWPLLKGVAYLATSPKLLGRRGRAVGVTLAIVALLVLVLGVLPMPAEAYAPGVVRAAEEASLRAGEDGFIERVHAEVGQSFRAGDVLLTLRNTDVDMEVAAAKAQVAQAEAELDAAHANLAKREVAERSLDAARARLERESARQRALVLAAPIDGTLVAGASQGERWSNLVGKFVRKGELLGRAASAASPIVRATVSDHDQAYVFAGRNSLDGIRPSVRLAGSASHECPATILRLAGAGSRRLADEALANTSGGDIVLDPTDPQQRTTITPQFFIEVRPEFKDPPPIGVRARVRLGIEPRPLVVQWWRRATQLFSERSQL